MDLLKVASYKVALRERVKELRGLGHDISLGKLADKLSLQPTYLSKLLGDAGLHLSEDALFQACAELEMNADDTERMMLLRAYEKSTNRERREMLYAQLENKRRKISGTDVVAVTEDFSADEARYLLSPTALLLHAAVQSKHLRARIRDVAQELGVGFDQFKSAMRLLEKNGFLTLGRNEWTIKEVKVRPLHFGRGHPIMRAHQQAVKVASLKRLQEIEEDKKVSFQATFTTDERGFELIKKEFDGFLGKARKISGAGRHTGVYQLGLDLFRWV